MKKLFVIAALAALPLTVSAKGFYVQGDLGVSNLHIIDTEDNDLPNKAVFTQRISVGYDFERFRIAVDYTNFGKAKFDDYDVSFKIQSFGVSGFYDFRNSSRFTPYVGARVGYSIAKITDYDFYFSETERKTSGSIGVLGGVQMKLADNLALNLGLEYNRLASDFGQFGGQVGLRYNF
ncbi:outer membrane autotransporter protein [Volucribacter psittacicida]|uniref:Outer membrane autotransporter protein n=1 Tax=Volucribacter psittacicida TaxID=203482 RepID=A0A4R1G5E3_9PAST|nr:opacity family porin [Volucribacter psittacicida]TCJ98931.1 outer membrane autotransporter protein [Volucribacter psittacicida]